MAGDGVETRVTVVNRKGLHARPSGKISKIACASSAQISITHGGHTADARSIMDLLLLIAPQGSELVVRGEGDGAHDTVAEITALIEDGFGEDD